MIFVEIRRTAEKKSPKKPSLLAFLDLCFTQFHRTLRLFTSAFPSLSFFATVSSKPSDFLGPVFIIEPWENKARKKPAAQVNLAVFAGFP